jgi:hypothetical protein
LIELIKQEPEEIEPPRLQAALNETRLDQQLLRLMFVFSWRHQRPGGRADIDQLTVPFIWFFALPRLISLELELSIEPETG